MKKIFIAIIMFLAVFTTKVFALEQYDSFYQGEKIEGVTYTKIGDVTQNRQAYIKRRTRDSLPVYCTEPFEIVKENYYYKGTDDNAIIEAKFSKELIEKIKLIAYYGYGYPGHESLEWYSVTQMMMWRAIDADSQFEWTDSIGGKIIEPYDEQIAKIEGLIAEHNTKPSLAKMGRIISRKGLFSIEETEVDLSQFEIVDSNIEAEIVDNSLVVKIEKIGDYIVKIRRVSNRYNEIPIFYFDAEHQDLMSVGALDNKIYNVRYEIVEGSITIKKVDKDTNSTVASGEASLIASVYDVFNRDKELVGKITIGEDSTGTLSGVAFSNYTIKESASGNGYTLDKNVYKVDVNVLDRDVELTLSNKVIENKVVLNKFFGNDVKLESESGIIFEVYDKKGNLVESIKTDDKGKAEITLPYGQYIIKQLNTSEGYYKVDDLTIFVNEDSLVQEFELIDLKIPNAETKPEEENTKPEEEDIKPEESTKAEENYVKPDEYEPSNEEENTITLEIPNAGSISFFLPVYYYKDPRN